MKHEGRLDEPKRPTDPAAWSGAVAMCARLGAVMKRRRLAARVSTHEVERRTGVKRQTLWQIETGLCVPTPLVMKRLAHAYRCDAWEFIAEAEGIPPRRMRRVASHD
jgi:transcriptional regulator with XRE-family HTH domain